MKTHPRYKIRIEDETRLETVAEYSASPFKYAAIGFVIAVILMALGALLVFLTPARTLLPGYLKESERAQSEMQMMRLDSIRQAYEANARYIGNIRDVLDPTATARQEATPSDSITLSEDSLLPTSAEEQSFLRMMNERDKYSISVVAPLAAESLMFSPVNDESVFSSKSKNELRAEIIMAKGAQVAAIADGTVIAVSQTIRDGGTTVIIQHPKGFLSRLSRLGTVLVEPGDVVSGGQIIALANQGNARKGEIISLEMWFDGDPVKPYDFIGGNLYSSGTAPVGTDRETGMENL